MLVTVSTVPLGMVLWAQIHGFDAWYLASYQLARPSSELDWPPRGGIGRVLPESDGALVLLGAGLAAVGLGAGFEAGLGVTVAALTTGLGFAFVVGGAGVVVDVVVAAGASSARGAPRDARGADKRDAKSTLESAMSVTDLSGVVVVLRTAAKEITARAATSNPAMTFPAARGCLCSAPSLPLAGVHCVSAVFLVGDRRQRGSARASWAGNSVPLCGPSGGQFECFCGVFPGRGFDHRGIHSLGIRHGRAHQRHERRLVRLATMRHGCEKRCVGLHQQTIDGARSRPPRARRQPS